MRSNSPLSLSALILSCNCFHACSDNSTTLVTLFFTCALSVCDKLVRTLCFSLVLDMSCPVSRYEQPCCRARAILTWAAFHPRPSHVFFVSFFSWDCHFLSSITPFRFHFFHFHFDFSLSSSCSLTVIFKSFFFPFSFIHPF